VTLCVNAALTAVAVAQKMILEAPMVVGMQPTSGAVGRGQSEDLREAMLWIVRRAAALMAVCLMKIGAFCHARRAGRERPHEASSRVEGASGADFVAVVAAGTASASSRAS
jgi:hypothetical protein